MARDTTFVNYNSRNFLDTPPTKATPLKVTAGVVTVSLPGTSYASDGNDVVFNKWAGTSKAASQNQSIVLGGGNDHYRAVGFQVPDPKQKVIVYGDEPGATLDACEGDRFDFGNDIFDVPSARYEVKGGRATGTLNGKVGDQTFIHDSPKPIANSEATRVWMNPYEGDKIYFNGDVDVVGVTYVRENAAGTAAMVSSIRVKSDWSNVVIQLSESNPARAKLEGMEKGFWVTTDGDPSLNDVQHLADSSWIIDL